jgi:translation initiation factor IF-3
MILVIFLKISHCYKVRYSSSTRIKNKKRRTRVKHIKLQKKISNISWETKNYFVQNFLPNQFSHQLGCQNFQKISDPSGSQKSNLKVLLDPNILFVKLINLFGVFL